MQVAQPGDLHSAQILIEFYYQDEVHRPGNNFSDFFASNAHTYYSLITIGSFL